MSEAQAAGGTADADVEVADHPESERYEVHVAGELAGFTDYQRGPGQIAFTHTEVDSAYSGQGLAGRLVQKALDDARAAGNEVLPFCPFFRGWIAKHPDYLGLVPEARRSEFDL